MKLYIISGLGADFKVLEKLAFPQHLEVVFLDWLIPKHQENFEEYVLRMSEKIDDSQPFYLLGYSFGGIVVQEIHKLKKAEKIVILGSIKSDAEKSSLIKIGQYTKIPKLFPQSIFNDKNFNRFSIVRRWFDPKNPKILQYFRVRDPYYLKWSIEKISDWKKEEQPEVIQILGERDFVFPLKNSAPDYVIKNGTHLFPATKHREVSEILKEIFA